MGKMWDPATTVAYNNATTTLSTIVSLDESPLLEGLLYVGTDDGNLQHHRGRRQDLAEDDAVRATCRTGTTSPTSSRRRATPTSCSSR